MNSYLQQYLKRKSSSDVQPLFYNSNNPIKEITESMGAFKTMYPQFIGYDDPIVNLHIGDGSHCRTAGLFAFNTNSTNWAIDPNINLKHMREWIRQHNVQRLEYFSTKWEDVIPAIYDQVCNLIFVHAHVILVDILKRVQNWKYIYINPCCMKNEQTLTIQYQREHNIETVLYGVDANILSEKNEVIVYKNMNYKE